MQYTGLQDYPHIEGKFITCTCPSKFVLNGPCASVCTENRKWEADPGQVECVLGDYKWCYMHTSMDNGHYRWSWLWNTCIYWQKYHSQLQLYFGECCFNIDLWKRHALHANEQILHVTCHSIGSWIPDPAQFTCSSYVTVPSGAET